MGNIFVLGFSIHQGIVMHFFLTFIKYILLEPCNNMGNMKTIICLHNLSNIHRMLTFRLLQHIISVRNEITVQKSKNSTQVIF